MNKENVVGSADKRPTAAGSRPRDVRRKSRFYCFTQFNLESTPVFDGKVFEYLCFGKETCPKTNRVHLQGFVAFKTRVHFTTAKKAFPGAHLEASRGSFEENLQYCRKDGDFSEFGQRPKTGSGGDAFATAIREAEHGNIESMSVPRELIPKVNKCMCYLALV